MAARPTLNFGPILARTGGIGRGFDTLRIVLSLSIVVMHSFGVALGAERADALTWSGVMGPACAALLPMFFGLSGFLVMGSAVRTPSLGGFIGLRMLRIVPALTTEIVLSALLLGPALTVLSLQAYYGDHRFYEYFGSLVGRIRTELPGVFTTNPTSVVNVSLWTVRPELGCYVYLAVLLLLRTLQNVRTLTIVSVVVLLINVAVDVLLRPAQVAVEVVPDRLLLLSFIAGNMMYVHRDRVPYHPALLVAGLVVGWFGIGVSGLGSVAVLAWVYCVNWLGVTALPRIPLSRTGDYSYGIYLYGFPVQQTMAHLFPELRTPALNLLLSLPVIVLLAVFSWHVVEKRALRLRRLLPKGAGAVGLSMGPTAGFVLMALLSYGGFLFLGTLGLPRWAAQVGQGAGAAGAVAFGLAAFVSWYLSRRFKRVAYD